MKAFKTPKKSIGNLDAETAATLITTAADVALVVGGDGVIQDIAFPRLDLASELFSYGSFLGRQWIDTVTTDSRPKVEALLHEASAQSASGWRQLNHPSSRGADVPILYSAVKLGGASRFVALGRDMRAIAKLQHQLVEAQVSMERDYSRLRHMETRYRLLFQVSSEPALIIDASSHKVVEANPAAVELMGAEEKKIVGRPLPIGFDPDDAETLRIMLASVLTAGQVNNKTVRLAHNGQELLASASLFRQGSAALALVRFLPKAAKQAADISSRLSSTLLQFVEIGPDAIVVTDDEGRILSANAAFTDMAQLASESQARGESLERWFGRPGIDLSVLMANLRQHGSVRLFGTTLRGEQGAVADIEVSAVPLGDGDTRSFGFAIRNVGLRLPANPRSERELPRSAQQLTELIGRVPLKDIVRETTDVVERLCIETALELTGDNRASAAEMLGLSRQSLYVKLRQFGIANLLGDSENQER